MWYLWLKLIHILSSTILFGTGIGTACVMVYGYMTRDIHVTAAINRYVVLADWGFTAPSAVVQVVTGLWMVYMAGFPLNSIWIMGAITGYIVAMCCWLPVVYLQIKMRDLAVAADNSNSKLPSKYHTYFKYWFFLGWPAFISLIIVFYLMTVKPV